MRKLIVFLLLFVLTSTASLLSAQKVQLEGYAYETGNRGFLNLVSIKVYNLNNQLIASTASDQSGIFRLSLPIDQDFIISAYKDIFKEKKMALSTANRVDGERLYLKVEMKRQPGYIFDVTMAEKRTKQQIKQGLPSDAIEGARVEVYNNTKKKQILDLIDYPDPTFKVHFTDGNHYTIMIRKKGYFTKRMEAYVNVAGCILCFDGIGEVKPGISEVMTESNSMGTLLANVELKPVKLGDVIKIENIYYNKNSAKIRKDAAEELDKLIAVLKDNPTLMIELGSHTDARGDTRFNENLSQQRADSAVKYLTDNTGVEPFRISAKGYGESKLVNGCKNGVECSERRHQMNRRTEIKVTGVLDVDPFSNFNLKQIIDRENSDQLLAEILNQEIVEVKAGEELPEEIKRQMEERKQEANELPDNEPIIMEVIEQAVVTSSLPFGANRRDNNDQKVKDKMKQDSILSKPMQPVEPVIRTSSLAKNKLDNPVQPKKSTSKILGDLEVEVNPQPSSTRFLEPGFAGYMVEFFQSASELPKSHVIFAKHGQVYKEQKKDGTFGYLFGPFAEWRDANRFLETTVIGNYKDAKVIRYIDGKRIE